MHKQSQETQACETSIFEQKERIIEQSSTSLKQANSHGRVDQAKPHGKHVEQL